MTNIQDNGWSQLDDFTKAYIDAALWSSIDDDGEPLDAQFDQFDINTDSIKLIAADCLKFQGDQAALLAEAYSSTAYARNEQYSSQAKAGHDFWLTRNHHGAGFWDRGLEDSLGARLTQACGHCGEVALCIGVNDGKLHYEKY